MTDIKVFDKRGKVAYHFFTPRNLTEEEINQDLQDWAVNPETHDILVTHS